MKIHLTNHALEMAHCHKVQKFRLEAQGFVVPYIEVYNYII